MKINVLDHGYVEFVEAWGKGKQWNDLVDKEIGIIEAARQSTQGSFRGWSPAECDCALRSNASHYDYCATKKNPGDKKLLSYLYSHNHMSPFEFAGMVIEVQAPIFVFREWHRHRTQSYNEMSARYEPLPDLYYEPSGVNVFSRMNKQTSNKQESGARGVRDSADVFCAELRIFNREAEKQYRQALDSGIPKELARLFNPVGHYSRMRASANLRNWLAFLTLRMDPAAQWEIRQFANAVGELIAQTFPRTWSLFNDNRVSVDSNNSG